MTDLHWELRHAKESFHAASVSLDCDQATMVTQHGKPMFTKVSSSMLPVAHSDAVKVENPNIPSSTDGIFFGYLQGSIPYP